MRDEVPSELTLFKSFGVVEDMKKDKGGERGEFPTPTCVSPSPDNYGRADEEIPALEVRLLLQHSD